MRILKRAVPLALVLVLGSQGSALATTRNVTIADFSFTPKVTRARLGDTVKWTNTAPGTMHTSTHDSGNPLVWDSGVISPGGGPVRSSYICLSIGGYRSSLANSASATRPVFRAGAMGRLRDHRT